jgi:osmotically-inducible protein OsmY
MKTFGIVETQNGMVRLTGNVALRRQA